MTDRNCKASEKYFNYALRHLTVGMDRKGTFARVPGSDLETYHRVEIDESDAHNVHAVKCSCGDHYFRKAYCRHMQIVDAFYARIRTNDKTYADAAADAFYAARGAEMAAKIDDAPLNSNANRVSSVVSKGATSIEAGLASRRLLR
jgi:hypothetical protein